MCQSPLSEYEKIMLRLRSLFCQYGYSRCRVSTFEEYDFYAHNRSALSGSQVLVFTDADGRLMALKPDVTMSLVKNLQDGQSGLQKLCYNENVYRIPAGGTGFRETVQTGLECIGQLDSYAIAEVIMLAARSLEAISPSYVLDVSHIGILDGLLDQALEENQDRTEILRAMEQKNLSALRQSCKNTQYAEALCTLCSLYGSLKDTLPQVKALAVGDKMKAACWELDALQELLSLYGLDSHVHLDFSIRGGTDYYSGLMLRGFVDGAAGPVLLGGQYDKLISRMGKTGGGIGFAVYLNQLGSTGTKAPDEDILLLYGSDASPAQVIAAVEKLQKQGLRVRAERQIPQGNRYGKLMKLQSGEVTEIG